MTQTEKQFKLSELARKMEMLEDERRALEATPVITPHKVWEPAHGEVYFFTPTLNYFHYDSLGDAKSKSSGLAHPTKEAAERHHSFLVMLHDLHKFAVEHNEGWKADWGDGSCLKYNIELHDGNLQVERWNTFQVSTLPVFKSRALAQKAIDTFGDRLKILFEYYNS